MPEKFLCNIRKIYSLLSIKQIFNLIFGVTIFFLLVLTLLFYKQYTSQKELSASYEKRYMSFLLADELRQSSDDLTRMARTFVITKNKLFEDNYWAILDIRNGKKERPEHNERIYWDFLSDKSGTKPRPDTVAIPLLDLMKQYGFTDQEFAKLAEAKRNSDGLVKTEDIAMNIVQGKILPEAQKMMLPNEGMQNFAIRIMHDETYHKNKANIMRPINEFLEMLDERTLKDVKEKEDIQTKFAATSTVLITLTLLFTIFGIFIMRAKVGKPLSDLVEVIKTIESEGNLKRRVEIHSEDEISKIGTTLNHTLDFLKRLTDDINISRVYIVEGNLKFRTDSSQYKGDFKDIIEGINQILDAIVKPITETANVLRELSIGNLKTSITGEYKGDYLLLKNSVNETILSLNSYIKESSSVLSSIAKGNMDVEISGEFKGEFIELKDSINQIIESFNQILNQINTAASEILLSAKQLSDSSQSLAQGSSEQASSTEEVTSALSQIEAQAGQNTHTAILTSETSKKVNEKAVIGNSEMVNLLKAMEELNDSSEKISKIIREIESIAFQTNILALNAAVEAARAGQHGKGFNVVATEVRNLAIRSSNSAKETSIMVEDTIKKIIMSAKLAQNTSNALKMIVEGIGEVNGLIDSIALSSREQTEGISQVNIGMNDISKITMSNSAASEEMAAASDELAGQAESFKNMIRKYKIKGIQENIPTIKKTEQPKKKITI